MELACLTHKGVIHLWRPHGGGGGQAQADACGRGKGSATCGRPHIKLEPTHVILYTSHAKKLALFWIRIWPLDEIKIGFFCQY